MRGNKKQDIGYWYHFKDEMVEKSNRRATHLWEHNVDGSTVYVVLEGEDHEVHATSVSMFFDEVQVHRQKIGEFPTETEAIRCAKAHAEKRPEGTIGRNE